MRVTWAWGERRRSRSPAVPPYALRITHYVSDPPARPAPHRHPVAEAHRGPVFLHDGAPGRASARRVGLEAGEALLEVRHAIAEVDADALLGGGRHDEVQPVDHPVDLLQPFSRP